MEEKTTTQTTPIVKKAAPAVSTNPNAIIPTKDNPANVRAGTSGRSPRRSFGGAKRNFRSRGPRKERPKPEFDQKIISLRRVTRVMKGGRRFSYSVAIILGDRKGRVGLGTGKANDTALAIQKAVNDARRNMQKLALTDESSIPYEVEAKFKSAHVTLRPNGGRGLVVGSSGRTILEFAGVKNTTGRVLTRSRNKLNNARAAMKALQSFSKHVQVKPQEPREPYKPFNKGARRAHKVNVNAPSAPATK